VKDLMALSYPWPSSKLVPHAKGKGWHERARLTRKARNDALALTCDGLRKHPDAAEARELWIEFYPPDARRRDCQNVIAACKAMIDGIAEALDVDDSAFAIHWPPRFAEAKPGGDVIVRFRPEYRSEGGAA